MGGGGALRVGPGSVSGGVAALARVGLGAQPLALPHHRLHHRGRSPQELGDVVLLDQTVQDALPPGHMTHRESERERDGGVQSCR